MAGVSAIAISLGLYHTCVIVTGGGVKCWGDNDDGQLGTGDTWTTNRNSPMDVALGSGLTLVHESVSCIPASGDSK
jgi:alpha-tubulin suppressor-like RCC1 family protein